VLAAPPITMTTPITSGRGPFKDLLRDHQHDESMLARLPNTDSVAVPLRTLRQRSRDGESFVVVANVPARSNLVIRVSAAHDVHASTHGLAGVTVAVRAVPLVGDDDEAEATRVFDRPTLPPLPSPSLPLGTVLPGHTEVLPASSSPGDPRAAQDTVRCPADRGPAQASARTTSWFAISAACLVLSGVMLFAALPTVEAPAPVLELHRSSPPVAAIETRVNTARALPVSAPRAPKPNVHPPTLAPSARIELRDLTLDVTSTPWMEVLVDGKSLGNTPRLHVELPRGNHEITLINRDLDLETRSVVSAEPGSSETQEIAFE
jgi:hypothetical protein